MVKAPLSNQRLCLLGQLSSNHGTIVDRIKAS